MGNSWSNTGTSLIILTEQVAGFSGFFGYSPTVGAGNLVFSIAAADGVDPYGNVYLHGVVSYTPNQTWSALIGGQLFLGDWPPGQTTLTDAAAIFTTDGSDITALISKTTPLTTSRLLIELIGATAGVDATLRVLDQDTVSAANIAVSGAAVKISADGGTLATWQSATAATNWSVGSLKYRLTAEDELWYMGSISYTGANVTAAGGAVVTTAAPAPYQPLSQWKDTCVHYTSASVQKNVASSVIVNTNGTLDIQWGDGMASTTHDVNGLATGDIFWIDTKVPLGNLA